MKSFKYFLYFLIITALQMLTAISFAADFRNFVYQGRIVMPDDGNVTGSVQFRLQIVDSAGTCVLWQETQTKTLTDGVFSVQLGAVAPDFDGVGSSSLSAIFDYGTAINCQGGTPTASVTPTISDDRNILLSVDYGTGWVNLPAQVPISTVPYALKTESAKKISGFTFSATAPANGQAMIYNSGSGTWEPQNLVAGGTITSVIAGTGLTGGATSGAATLNVDLAALLPAQTGNSGRSLQTASPGSLAWSAVSGGLVTTVTKAVTVNNPIVLVKTAAPVPAYDETVTIDIPVATSSVNGYVSSTDWTTFNNKLSAISNTATLASGKVWLGDGASLAQEQTLSQDISVSTAGVVTINKIQNRAIDSTDITGGLMMWDTATTTWKGKAFPACTAAQSPYWDSASDSILCQTIAAAWASITGKPTTISGYGATDGISGSGTNGTIPKLTASTTIANSIVTETASKIGIGTTPDTKLHVNGTIKIGNGSETCTAAGNGGMLIYNAGIIQYCNGSAWTDTGSGANFTALTSDVTATGTGSVSATVANVGGVTAANVATGANLANAATDASTVSVLASRDATGITSFKSIRLDGATSGSLTMTVPATVTNNSIVFPSAPPGTANYVLASTPSGAVNNLSWIAPETTTGSISLTTKVSNTLPIANGGTNSGSLTNDRIMVSSSNAITTAAALTNGQLLIGSTGAAPVATNITGTANRITVTNGAGSITLSSPQDLDIAASPTFSGLTISTMTTAGFVKNNSSGVLSGGNNSSGFSLTSEVVDTLPVASGGTGAGSFTANGLLYGAGTSAVAVVAPAASSVLISNGSNVPAWTAITNNTFTQYALLAGNGGGQNIRGGTNVGGNLILDSTSNPAKGNIIINPSGGNVGILTASPTSERLEINGTAKASNFITTSDRRLKTNINTLENGLEKIKDLTGVSFDWINNGEKDIGFIAQDVERVYPELVATDKINGFKSVRYSAIVSPLIEALKEIEIKSKMSSAQFNKLSAAINKKLIEKERTLASIEEENKNLHKLMNRLEQAVSHLEQKNN
jgi:hypothetical protein